MIMMTLLSNRNMSTKYTRFDKIIHSLVPKRNVGEGLKDVQN
jgi:hypothetical protein